MAGWLKWALARASMLSRQAYSTAAVTEAMRAGVQSFGLVISVFAVSLPY
jgi:hypothetical protein